MIDKEKFFDKLLETLIITDYTEKFSQMLSPLDISNPERIIQRAIDYYNNRWEQGCNPFKIDTERTIFRAKVDRKAHLIMDALEKCES